MFYSVDLLAKRGALFARLWFVATNQIKANQPTNQPTTQPSNQTTIPCLFIFFKYMELVWTTLGILLIFGIRGFEFCVGCGEVVAQTILRFLARLPSLSFS